MTPPLFILGATASGKSAVALELARRTGAALLVMDAMQVYRGLQIGVGKPSAVELQEVRHGGLDLVDWTESFDVARYLAAARDFLSKTTQPVIICGGTGLYFKALTQGLCQVPPIPPSVRQSVSGLSAAELREQLQREDPEICDRLDLNNPRRVQRALECVRGTGRSLRDWQRETPPPLIAQFQAVWLVRSIESLRARIDRRVDAMLQAGWPEEVAHLLSTGTKEKLAECPAIGYRELMQVRLHHRSLESARREIQIQTGQYARRQITWLRRATGVVSLAADRPVEPVAEDLLGLWQSVAGI